MANGDRVPPRGPAALDDELAAVIDEVRAGRERGEATTFGVALRVFLARLRLSLTIVAGHTEIGEDTLGLARAGRSQRYLTPEQISHLVITLAGLYPRRLSLARYSAWLVALHGLVAVERTLGYLRRGYGGVAERLDDGIEARLRLDLRALLSGLIAEMVGPDLERLRLSHAGRPVESSLILARTAGRGELQAPRGPVILDRRSIGATPPTPRGAAADVTTSAAQASTADTQPPPMVPGRSLAASRARSARPVPPASTAPSPPPRPAAPGPASEPPSPLDPAADAAGLLLVINDAPAPLPSPTLGTLLRRLLRRSTSQ